MKIACLSDIHGNAVALEAVLNDLKGKNIDQILVLGDICYRGPAPQKALDLVRSLPSNTIVLKGNADEWVVRGVRDGEVPEKALPMMQKEREWTIGMLSKGDLDYLSTLAMDCEVQLTEDIKIYAFHATPTSLFEVVPQDENAEIIKEKLWTKSSADLYLYGHIHFPYTRFLEGKAVANTGSIGLPFDGQPLASYLLVEGDKNRFKVSIERVPYDIEKTIHQFEKSDYPNKEMMISIVRNGKLPSA